LHAKTIKVSTVRSSSQRLHFSTRLESNIMAVESIKK